MLLLVEDPPLNHSDAFFGEKERNGVSEAPVEKCATRSQLSLLSVKPLVITLGDYLAGSIAPKGTQSKA